MANLSLKSEKLTKFILSVFRDTYDVEHTDDEILDCDPNTFDMDPASFYEALEISLHVSGYPKEDGETVKETIARLTEEWDGKTMEENPFFTGDIN